MQRAAALICHVIYRLDYGGLENGLVNLVNHLPHDRFQHAIVCLAGIGAMRARIEREDVRVVSIDKRPGKDPASYARAWRVLRSLSPDVVHTRNLGTIDLQWVAWAAGVRRRLHGEHGWDATDPVGNNPHTRRIRRACRPVIQRYVAMSRDIERWLHDDIGVPSQRIRQVYNGVDACRYRPGGTLPRDWPWHQHAREALWVCGTVGRLDPLKNQVALVDAFAALVSQQRGGQRSLRLVIAANAHRSKLRIQNGAGAAHLSRVRAATCPRCSPLSICSCCHRSTRASRTLSSKRWRAACRWSPPGSAAMRNSSKTRVPASCVRTVLRSRWRPQ
jgi:sugar transferase (PEP-CTERM/EpsH1 system associated)